MADLTSRATERIRPLVEAARTRTSTAGRTPRTAVVIGRVLGAMFAICFLTGLYSHVLQDQLDWLPMFPQPSWLYRVTQGTHVLVGLALIPLLLGKLWSVFPRLFTWPPVTGPLSFLERASIAVLVSSAVLEVAIGVMNIAQWYVFPFSFRRVHFALAWVLIGSVVLHVAVKLPTIAAFWRAHSAGPVDDDPDAGADGGADRPHGDAADADDPATPPSRAEMLSRRGILIGIGAAAGGISLVTAGQTVDALAPIALLSPRRMNVGPQGLPINRTAAEAGVHATAASPEWRLELVGDTTMSLSLEEMRALPQTEVVLPIACVEGWSQLASWGGVRVRQLLELVGAPAASDLRITSLQTRGAFAVTEMRGEYAQDETTLVALRLAGGTLDIDHGYPARIIAPGRPGVLQTKWLARIEVLS